MKIFNSRYSRPLTPATALAVVSVPASATQAFGLGQLPVGAAVHISPTFGVSESTQATSKINFIGKAESPLATGVVQAAMWDHQVENQLVKAVKGVKVTDARGIPPRGRPV